MHQVNYDRRGDLYAPTDATAVHQTPAPIVILTAAASEVNLFAQAAAHLKWGGEDLRLMNILALNHPHAIDHYCQDTLVHAKIILVRVLGGVAYWRHGCDAVASLARKHGIAVGFIPGDGRPDPELMGLSTMAGKDLTRLAAYADQGGADNAAGLLMALQDMVTGNDTAPPVRPLLAAGLYWPGTLKGASPTSLADMQALWDGHAVGKAKRAAILFYRATMQAADTEAIDGLVAALLKRNIAPVPIYCLSLKHATAASIVAGIMAEARVEVIVNTTSFAVSDSTSSDIDTGTATEAAPPPFDVVDCPIIQAILSGSSEGEWQESSAGLTPRDLTMNVVLPELDGRIIGRAIGFKSPPVKDELTQAMLIKSHANANRVEWLADLAGAWLKLRQTPPPKRNLVMILANYPNKDGRLANGVGLDTPASAVVVLDSLKEAGYATGDFPASSAELMTAIKARPTNNNADKAKARRVDAWLSLADYKTLFARLPAAIRQAINQRWGKPATDPMCLDMPDTKGEKGFALPVMLLGKVAVAVQPARGYNIDPKASYHDSALPPPHNYIAFYLWCRHRHQAHALIHLGKHGNVEWLPGKALALAETCLPEACVGAIPHFYPFIVNDPGEGSQAKRRTAAVILDHLTPPMAEADSHGVMAELETSMDEYYEASGIDAGRSRELMADIISQAEAAGLATDCGITDSDSDNAKLQKLDNFLCDIKEMQIRDGLHIYATLPATPQLDGLLLAMLKAPRGDGEGRNDSLVRALAKDIFANAEFDPLTADRSQAWQGSRPSVLHDITDSTWRSAGDTVERLNLLAAALISGKRKPDKTWQHTKPILLETLPALRQALTASAASEKRQLLRGLDGKYVPAGQAGAPTRGRLDVLPTGRNFFSIDTRAVPTPMAWRLGWASANALLDRHHHDHGNYPKAVAVTAWGTANMRTGGDDLAQAMALLGVEPRWDGRRVVGFGVMPLSVLGRPRVDVTLRVSGFFRDAFPQQIILMDKAIRAVAGLDESPQLNPIAARVKAEASRLEESGLTSQTAQRHASYRIFSSKPGAYGAGLQTLIDEGIWDDQADFADAFLTWGGYAYGEAMPHASPTSNGDATSTGDGWQAVADRQGLERRLSVCDAVIHNQDNREHDILDSDDYYQFTGGLAASISHLRGSDEAVPIYMGDHALVDRPRIRALSEEIARVVRGRASNPKWIAGVMRHGYKGAFEMAATLDYLFAFAATTGQVESHHFDMLFASWIEDDGVADFIRRNNRDAYYDMLNRFNEAIQRGLWQPRRNAPMTLLASQLQQTKEAREA